jgi:enoyl-[acyl-carrier protein] reductase I
MDGLLDVTPSNGKQTRSPNWHTFGASQNERSNLMPLLEGKKALIFGIANHRSIGWAIAQSLAAEGAQLVFSYQERMEKYVRDLAAKIPGTELIECDVQSDEQLDAAFARASDIFNGELDILIHSVAYAPPRELENPFYDTSREGFHTALDISAYSLIAMAKRAMPLMQARGSGSMLTLTYMASERVVPKYNVMAVAKAALECSVRFLAYEMGEHNIRVNAISAGPLNTLAARGVSGITQFREQMTIVAPLRRNIEQSEVGDAALFLCSPLARAITGEIMFVDAGYNIMGFGALK